MDLLINAIFVPLLLSLAWLPSLNAQSTCHPDSFPDKQYGKCSPEIRYKSHAEEKDRLKLDSWSLGVGPPLILVPPGAGEPGIERFDSLVVVSWNVHVGGGDLDRFIGDLQAGRLTEGEPVSDYVLLVQEAFRKGVAVPSDIPAGTPFGSLIRPAPRSGARIDIEEIARRYGLFLFYVPCMRNGGPGDVTPPEDRGNAILSTMPLDSFMALELPYVRERRLAAIENVSATSKTGRSWALRLVNVHLENRAAWPEWLGSFGGARLRQVKALTEEFSNHVPTILAGDFNTWFGQKKEPAIRDLENYFVRSTGDSDAGTVRLTSFFPERLVDYIFFRLPEVWEGRYRRLNSTYGSDHYPLLARIGIHK